VGWWRIRPGAPHAVGKRTLIALLGFLVAHDGPLRIIVVDAERDMVNPDQVSHIGDVIDELIQRRPCRGANETRKADCPDEPTGRCDRLDEFVWHIALGVPYGPRVSVGNYHRTCRGFHSIETGSHTGMEQSTITLASFMAATALRPK